MSSKKKNESNEPKNVIFGRIGTNLKIGIVGLPNVGKSTFFNVLTNSQASASNFPFCTIEPNESRVPVPDVRYDFLCDFHKPVSKVPAFLHVVDIAGLVKGASEGQGLGNAFLSHIRGVDGIFHMIRTFDDIDVTHVDGDVDPIRDMTTIFEELRLKDEAYLDKELEKVSKVASRGNDKQLKEELATLTKLKHVISEEKKSVRFAEWNEKEIELLNKHLFITAKPMIYLINLSEKDFIRKKNKWLSKIMEWIKSHDPQALIIPISAEFELKWQEMQSEEERAEYLKANPGVSSNLTKIVQEGHRVLGLQYFFTCGKDEVKAWTIQKFSKAPTAAGRIHSDMEKGFIMAEVMAFEDFKEHGSENGVKSAGKYKQRGKDYVVEDGDIILFKFNAGAGLTAGKKK